MSLQPLRLSRPHSKVLFIYSSRPTTVATTIEIAISRLKLINRDVHWYSWREVNAEGTIIPATVSREIGGCAAVVADMTSMNLNIVFELGIAIGAGVQVVPIRDVSYESADGGGRYKSLGFVDSLGAIDFRNSDDLVKRLATLDLSKPTGAVPGLHPSPRTEVTVDTARSRHVLTVHGAFDTEGVRQLAAALEKAEVETRVISTSSISGLLEDLLAEVKGASGVIVHLMDPDRSHVIHLLEPNRRGVFAENARGVFIAGMANGAGIPLILLQEGYDRAPVDYSRLVQYYADPSQIKHLLRDYLTSLLDSFLPDTRDSAMLARLASAQEDPVVRGTTDPADALAACLGVSLNDLADGWLEVCVPLINDQSSYSYALQRTSGGAQDFIFFLRTAARQALARHRDRISQSDILHAESLSSEITLARMSQKLVALGKSGSSIADALTGISEILPADEIVNLLADAGLDAQEAIEALGVLLGEGALGVWDPRSEEPTFRVSAGHSDELSTRVVAGSVLLAVHPSLHSALRVRSHVLGSIWPPVWSVG
jgi:hypothetical protein